MMAYNQNEYQEASKELKFAGAVFTAVAAGEIARQLANLSSMAAWDWIILWRGLTIGLVAGGAAYAIALIIVTIAPGLPALLLKEVEEMGKPKPVRPDLPTGQPKRERPYIQTPPLSDEPTFEESGVVIEAAPEWQRLVDSMNYGDGRMLINGRLIELPEAFDTDWLYTIAERRAASEMDKTISTIKLNDVGISRWGNGSSPAAMVIEVLEEARCVQSRGVNQPYDWTDAGKRAFPSPTDR